MENVGITFIYLYLTYEPRINLLYIVFKLKENVYITEFELSVDYCFNCLAAVLSDSTAVYIISDSTNVNIISYQLPYKIS